MKELYLGIKNILCDISSDKYPHCIVCMILTLLLFKVFTDGLIVISIVAGISVVKELFDKFVMKEKFDFNDLEADGYGILIAIILTIL